MNSGEVKFCSGICEIDVNLPDSLSQKFEPLVSIVRKSTLTPTDVDTCTHKILAFQQMQVSSQFTSVDDG